MFRLSSFSMRDWVVAICCGLFSLMTGQGLAVPPVADHVASREQSTEKRAARHQRLAKLQDLHLLGEALVIKAETGEAPATTFRIEARSYREALRQIMLQDADTLPVQKLPRVLLLDMVRMSALLHSAADCKTGFVITCPPDLLRQLQRQSAKVAQQLQMAAATAH